MGLLLDQFLKNLQNQFVHDKALMLFRIETFKVKQ